MDPNFCVAAMNSDSSLSHSKAGKPKTVGGMQAPGNLVAGARVVFKVQVPSSLPAVFSEHGGMLCYDQSRKITVQIRRGHMESEEAFVGLFQAVQRESRWQGRKAYFFGYREGNYLLLLTDEALSQHAW
jgi:hypothetical protein